MWKCYALKILYHCSKEKFVVSTFKGEINSLKKNDKDEL